MLTKIKCESDSDLIENWNAYSIDTNVVFCGRARAFANNEINRRNFSVVIAIDKTWKGVCR